MSSSPNPSAGRGGRKWEETKQEELSISLFGPLSRLTDSERNTIMTSASPKEILETLSRAEILPTKEEEQENESAG